MAEEYYDLYIFIGNKVDADEEYLEELAHQLAEELRQLDNIESIESVQTKNPSQGEKGPSISVGTILVKIAEVGGFSALVTLLGSWLSRDRSRTLKLQLKDKSLEVTGLSKAEQQELVRWFQTQAGLRLDS